MRAAYYEDFREPITIREVADPTVLDDGVVVRVRATGICRSDWHGWMGHDPDIVPPHVPGHELAGVVEEVGRDVRRWAVGDRVTVPFVSGCGRCPPCLSGDPQICDDQFQPGFHGWGSFAERVGLRYADTNLVGLPEELDFVTAASLGCRFGTAFRAVEAQGRVSGGEWVAVHGCGGVGLSAVMIASALGAQVVAVDIRSEALDRARAVGAAVVLDSTSVDDVAGAVRDITGGGAHVSLDALGSLGTCFDSVACLRKRGKHIQVGLIVVDEGRARVPMSRVIAHELEILGSHGIQAIEYDRMLAMIAAGTLDPQLLVEQTVTMEEGLEILTAMNGYHLSGVTVIDRL